jgi:NAD(P)-dependent dehydrogenase (short-subunit alcohol dehydrogenase family)
VNLELDGKRAIVTGASRGIGRAVATALAAEGASVVLVARGSTDLDTALQALRSQGHAAVAVPADTSDDSTVRAMVAEAVSSFGGIDILVNAAAQPSTGRGPRRLAEIVDHDMHLEFDTKVMGYLRCARAVAPHMAAQGWGRIVNVGGLIARKTGNTFGSVRNVAIAAMSKNLADELGSSGINVTVVHPATTVTERTPDVLRSLAEDRGLTEAEVLASLSAGVSIGRLVQAHEVADVVVFLASPRSVAINGDAIAVGGGSRGSIHY